VAKTSASNFLSLICVGDAFDAFIQKPFCLSGLPWPDTDNENFCYHQISIDTSKNTIQWRCSHGVCYASAKSTVDLKHLSLQKKNAQPPAWFRCLFSLDANQMWNKKKGFPRPIRTSAKGSRPCHQACAGRYIRWTRPEAVCHDGEEEKAIKKNKNSKIIQRCWTFIEEYSWERDNCRRRGVGSWDKERGGNDWEWERIDIAEKKWKPHLWRRHI